MEGISLGQAVRPGKFAGWAPSTLNDRRRERESGPVPQGWKRCARCLVPKRSADFARRTAAADGLQPWCRTCVRLYHAERYRTLSGAEKESRREYQRAWAAENHRRLRDEKREKQRRWRQTPIGRLCWNRRTYRQRLRQATDPARIARLEALIAQYDAEIARLRALRDDRGIDDGPVRAVRRMA